MTPDERTAWLADRRLGVGSSDVAKILGISPFGSSFELWLDKTGRSEDEIRSNEPYYKCQCLWEMIASGAEVCYLTELVRGHEIAEFRIAAEDHRADMQMMLEAAVAWWDAHIIHDNPPDPLARDVKLIQRLFPSVDVDASVDLPDDLVQQYLTAKAAEEEASMLKDGIQTKLQMLMGAAKRGKSGLGKVSWYSVAGRESVDLKALRKDHPEAAKLIKRGSDYRVFKLP